MKIIIIGAGPAGITAGYVLIEKGFDILLLEKSIFPRDKICAGGITPRSVKILGEVYGANFISNMESKFLKIRKVKIASPNGTEIIDCIPSRNAFPDYGFVADRKSFDAMLLDKFKSIGGKIIFEKAVGINETSNIVATEKNRYKGDRIIIAAGFNSFLFHKTNYDMIINTALLRNKNGTGRENKEGCLEIFFDNEILPGYIWKFPEKKGFNIGCGFFGKKSNKEIERIMKANGNVDIESDFSNMSRWPIGINFSCKSDNSEIIIIGDAMGIANPVTGEGIFYAIASGRLAAEAIVENDFDLYRNAIDSLLKKRNCPKYFLNRQH